tara:strand:- start:342 stop:476 length:135 start_codon:yes stop_codon:yes gene_type:complete
LSDLGKDNNEPGDPFPDFFEPPPGTAFTGIGGRLIQDEVELGAL